MYPQNVLKMFDSIDSELSVKTKTDGNSNKQTGGGSELRNLSLPYKLVASAGVDILKELETIKTMQQGNCTFIHR